MQYLRDKVGAKTTVRNAVVHRVFGTDGLTESPTLDVFNDRAAALQTFCDSSVSRQFSAHLTAKVLPLLKKNYVAGRSGWTNNNCESGNHILKTVIDWKPRSVASLVERLEATVKAQTKELERALYGRGNFTLSPGYERFRLSEHEWIIKTNDQRDKYFRKFLKHVPSSVPTVTSKDGALKVMSAPLAGKKPNQLKRKRAARTTTVTFQKV